MSRLSFLISCIEQYSQYSGYNGDETYSVFRDQNLLTHLNENYGDLHGMSFEYLMGYFDAYLGSETHTANPEYHALYNSIIVHDVVKYIAEKYSVSESQALDIYYTSDTAKALSDPETGLYGQSALYIFSVYLEEKEYHENA